MTKPVVVLRADTAPTPVTYTQLDQNFINLRDATIGFRLPGVGTEPARTAKIVTPSGDAQVSTVQKKFGLGSLALDGTGDYATISTSTDFGFGTGDWTVEGWYYKTATPTNTYLLDLRSSGTDIAPMLLTTNTTLAYYTAGTIRITANNALPSENTWYHVAVSRSGNSTKLFINGTQVGSTYTDTQTYTSTSPLYLGTNSTQLAGRFWTGYIDEFRITKGLARYTENFTPPTEAFTNDANTVLLLHFNTDLSDDVGFAPAEDTVVDIDLNSALTFVAGTGISLALDTATDTLTINSNAETNSITQGNSNVTVTDTGTGQIDFTVDGTAVMQLKSTGLTAYRETVYAGGNTSTAITPNYANGNIQTFTANSNFTLNLPTNMAAGQNLVLIITQDATGSRVMTSNAGYKFVNGSKILSIAPNYIDILSIFYDGSRYLCNLNKGYR